LETGFAFSLSLCAGAFVWATTTGAVAVEEAAAAAAVQTCSGANSLNMHYVHL